MALTRLNNARQPMATGIIAPLMRVATHLGYCTNLAGLTLGDENHPDEEAEAALWDERWHDIKEDLAEALGHMGNPPDMSPFLPQEVIDAFQTVKDQINDLREGTFTKDEVFTNLQILNHNVAYVAGRFEHFATGEEVTEGSQA